MWASDSCDLGFHEIKSRKFASGADSMKTCVHFNFDDLKKLVWAHYFLAYAYYELRDYHQATINAGQAIEYYERIEEMSIFNANHIEFLKHILEDIKKEYSSESAVRAGSRFRLIMSDDDCNDENNHLTAHLKDAYTLHKCRSTGLRDLTSHTIYYQDGDTMVHQRQRCEDLEKEYENCIILYCTVTGLSPYQEGFEPKASEIECEQNRIAFLTASAYEQRMALFDLIHGPDYYLEDTNRRHHKIPNDNPFANE